MDNIDNCKMCFDPFQGEIRPRCLPCGHSFCTSCLNDLIEEGKLSCPSCKQKHRAINGCDFPVNYGMEELILQSTTAVALQDDTGVQSNNMKALMEEHKVSTLNLIHTSEDLQSQIKEYDEIILSKKNKHEELLQKINNFANQNEVAISCINKEHHLILDMLEKGEGIQENVKAKLSGLDTATGSKTAIKAVSELDCSVSDLEEWTGSCQRLPNLKIFATSEEVLINSIAGLAFLETLNNVDVPDFTHTQFSIGEKLSKILGNGTITLQKFKEVMPQMMEMIKAGKLYAFETIDGCIWSSRLTVKDDQVHLHYLQKGNPPDHVHIIKHSELIASLDADSTTVFMDLTWDGTVRDRVHIILTADTPLARQFRVLCTGDFGITYAHSWIFNISNKSTPNESLMGGDYENNNGTGGAWVIKELTQANASYQRAYTLGTVYAPQGATEGPRSAQFSIVTYAPSGTAYYSFGQVKEGMDVVINAAKVPVGNVRIADCGVVLPFDDKV